MRIVLKNGEVHHTKARTDVIFTKVTGHGTRVEFDAQVGGWRSVKARQVEGIYPNKKRGGPMKD